jgi:hypothetical protein
MIKQDNEKPAPAGPKRAKLAAAAKARLVDPHQAANRGAHARPGDVHLANSKLRGCDVVALKVEDIAPHGYAVERATVRQKKTGRPVRLEVSEQTLMLMLASLAVWLAFAISAIRIRRRRRKFLKIQP